MGNHAVFFDRDGTLNYDPGYLGDPGLVKLYPGVREGIHNLKENYNFKIVVISNQSGISRGYLTHQDVQSVNKKINELISKKYDLIDAFYYCPYHPDFDTVDKCECRKPSPKMVYQAAQDLDLELSKSYFVGDKSLDVECGINAGLKTILINSSLSDDEINNLHKEKKSPNFIATNFSEACNFILNDH